MTSVFNVSYPQGKSKTRTVRAKGFIPPHPSEGTHISASSKTSHNRINVLSRSIQLIHGEYDRVQRIFKAGLLPATCVFIGGWCFLGSTILGS